MFGVSRRTLQMGELPRDLFKREDAPQVAALAVHLSGVCDIVVLVVACW